MAQYGIQYTPQFIQTDLGAIRQKYADLDAQYDAGYNSALAAEDAFGQFDVDQRDIELKNEVLGGFKNRVKSLVDRYGGDWGAASKQLASEIVRTKNDKFFPIAARRKMLSEEQRKAELRPGNIVLKDVRNVSLKDANGNYISPDELSYKVVTKDELRSELRNAYAGLADRVRESGFHEVKGFPYLIQKAVTKGITDGEVPGIAQLMFNNLKEMYPELKDDIAKNIALEEASKLVKGTQRDERSNAIWERDQRIAENTPPPGNGNKNLFNIEAGGLAERTGIAEDYNDLKNSFENTVKMMNVIKGKIAETNKLIDEKKRIFGDKYKPGELEHRVKNYSESLSRERKNYANNEKAMSERFPIYGHLKKMNIPVTEAFKATAKHINNTEDIFKVTLTAKDPSQTIDAISRLYSKYNGPVYEEVDGKVKKVSVNKEFIFDKENIVKWGTRGNVMEIVRRVPDPKNPKKTVNRVFNLPANKTDDLSVNVQSNYMDAVKNAYNGNNGFGRLMISSTGEVVNMDDVFGSAEANEIMRRPYPGYTYVTVDYNSKDGIKSSILDNLDGVPQPASMNSFVTSNQNELMRNFGVGVDYQDYKQK